MFGGEQIDWLAALGLIGVLRLAGWIVEMKASYIIHFRKGVLL